MGWTFLDHKPHAPKQYMDNLATFENDKIKSEVLKSGLKNLSEYYAALKQTNKATGKFRIVCAVSMVRFEKDGYGDMIMGYKDMDEYMGPSISNCPESILKLLPETDHEHASEWRKRCWANIESRKAVSKALKHGNKVTFKEPVRFTSGVEHKVLYVWRKGSYVRFSAQPTIDSPREFTWQSPCYMISKRHLVNNLVLD